MSLCHNVELHWVLKWPKEPGTQIKGGLGWPCSACPPWCIILIITTLLIKSLIGIHQGTPELVGVPVEPHSLHRWGSHRARVTDATASRAFFTSVTCARCEPVNRTGCQFCCSLMNSVALWWAVPQILCKNATCTVFASIKFRIFTICSVCNGLSLSFGQKYARGSLLVVILLGSGNFWRPICF